jgi:hypothetical protein
LRPGCNEQIGVRANADHDQHKVDVPAEGLLVGSEAIDVEPAAAVGGPADASDG